MAEGTEVGTAYVSLVPSAAGFGTKLQQLVSGEAGQAGQQAGKALGAGISGQASTIAKGIAGIFAGIGTARFFQGALAEAQEAVKVGNLTNAVIKSTGGVANVTAGEVGKLAANLSKVAGVDDELVQAGENVLLTFAQVRNQVGAGNDIFNQATKAALDMSAALGTDLQGAIIQLGKALQSPTQGLLALRRSGVSFTEGQQEQIKALEASGDLLAAQKIILSEVNKEFGGAAAANATALDRMHVAVLNTKEAIGTALLPAVNSASVGLTEILGVFTALPGPIQSVGAAFVGLGAASIAVALLTPKIRSAREELQGMGAAGAAADRGLAFLGRAGLVAAGTAALVAGLKAVRDKAAELSGGGVGSIPKLTEDIADFLTTGVAVGDLADQFGAGLSGIGESLRLFTDDQGGFKSIDRLLDPAFSAVRDDIDSLDKTLAGLVSGGHKDAAVQFFNEIVRLAGEQGVSVDEVNAAFNDYGDAMSGAAAEGKLAKVDFEGAGDASAGSGEKAEEAAKKWNELHGQLEDLIQSDWSKKLASDLTSALDPMERFVTTSSKSIADLRTSVDGAAGDLADARAELDKLAGPKTTDPVEAFLSRGSGATEAQIDAARDKVDKATAALAASQKKLAEAQKSPLATIRDNLTANLNQLTSWLGNITKLSKGGHETLAKDLAALGPEASGAVAEAAGASPAQLSNLEGLFVKRDKLVADAASGAFELNVDQVGKPGETLAQIIADRYQKTLVPKFKDATLAALNEATAVLLGQGSLAGIEGAFPTTEPGPGEAHTPPIGSIAALVGVAAPATTTKSVVVNIDGPVPDPTLLGKAIAWEI